MVPDATRYPYNCTLCRYYKFANGIWGCGYRDQYGSCKGSDEWLAKSKEERRINRPPKFMKEE